ncbi:MAG: InlB B-repeat-containing protein [Treponema sp.]|nr:InlB B-repeat-containing protein [Treponema sp.]
MKTKISILFTAIFVITVFFAACQLEEIASEKVTVTFEFADADCEEIEPVVLEKGQSLGINFPSTPVRTEDNFEFIGWYDGFDEYTSDTKVFVDITLTAKWIEKFEYVTVSFNVDGATAPTPVKVVKGGVMGVSLPAVLKKKGYLLDRWEHNGTLFTKDTKVDSSITLSARWGAELNTFTVTFDSQGGTEVDSITVYEGDCIDEWEVRFPVFPDDIEYPDDELHFLKEWRTSDTVIEGEDGEGNPEEIIVAGIVYTGRTPIREDVELNAIWGIRLVKVTFELDLSEYTTTNYNVAGASSASFNGSELTVNFTGENQAVSISTSMFKNSCKCDNCKGTNAPPDEELIRMLLGMANTVTIDIDAEVNYEDRTFRVLLGNIHLLGREWNATVSHDNVVLAELNRELQIGDNIKLDTNTEHEEYNPDPDYKRVNWIIIQSRGSGHSAGDPTVVTIKSLKITLE